MNLKKLKEQLTRKDIDFRVSHLVGKDIVYAIILAYKDARVDMRILDEACGQLGWKNSYQRDSKGVLQCSISIWDEDKKQWVSKTSNGVESFTESQKGEYSDAFKRAGFMWGIGRGLYDFCFIMVTCDKDEYYMKDGKAKATSKLRPNDWIWEISEDYQDVKAYKKYGSKKEIKFNSKGYKKELKDNSILDIAIKEATACKNVADLEEIWNKYPDLQKDEKFKNQVKYLKETIL